MTEQAQLQAAWTSLLAAAALACLGGCDSGPAAAVNAASNATAPAPDYRPAPELLGGGSTPDGRLELMGSALPGAAVRLSSPTGEQQFTTAGPKGGWRFVLAPSAAPRLLSLSMSDNGRVVQAVEYLFVAPGVVARLRAGGGSQAPAPDGADLAALTLDFDNQRAATLSGMAGPRETVTVRVDGVEKGQAGADTNGRFVLPLEPLAAGPHEFTLIGASQEIHFTAKVDAPTALGKATFAAAKVGPSWRVDWVTPGGGEQTTLILGPSEPGA